MREKFASTITMIWTKGDQILINTVMRCVKNQTVKTKIANIHIIKFNKYTILQGLRVNFVKFITINKQNVNIKNFVLLLIPSKK